METPQFQSAPMGAMDGWRLALRNRFVEAFSVFGFGGGFGARACRGGAFLSFSFAFFCFAFALGGVVLAAPWRLLLVSFLQCWKHHSGEGCGR